MKTEQLSSTAIKRLETERNIWVATCRQNNTPHLTPVWFAWHNQLIYICIQPTSVKAKNIRVNAGIALSLENGNTPIICEGKAQSVEPEWDKELIQIFEQKYDWRIDQEDDYTQLVAITPEKWLVWGDK